MILRQQLRTLATLLLATSLSLWAETGPAVAAPVGHGPECHAHSTQVGHAAMTAEQMASGCCPEHAVKAGCPSHPGVSLAPMSRPDCCAVNGAPEQPVSFLVTSSISLHPYASAAIAVAPELALAPAAEERAELPLYTRPVLDQKADLRI